MTGAQTTSPRILVTGARRGIGCAAVALARGDFGFSTGNVVHVDGGLHIHRM